MENHRKAGNLVIHYIDCLALDCSLEQWEPEDPRSIELLLEVCVGWVGWDAYREIFYLRLVSHDLRRRPDKERTPALFVEEFCWPDIKDTIFGMIVSCERAAWDQSFAELRKRFLWYYEDASWAT